VPVRAAENSSASARPCRKRATSVILDSTKRGWSDQGGMSVDGSLDARYSLAALRFDLGGGHASRQLRRVNSGAACFKLKAVAEKEHGLHELDSVATGHVL
jgi:hypothetical protein